MNNIICLLVVLATRERENLFCKLGVENNEAFFGFYYLNSQYFSEGVSHYCET